MILIATASVLALGVVVVQGVAPINLSGTYTVGSAANKALTESKGLPYRVAGAGGGAPPPGATAPPPTVVVITQTSGTLTIDRKAGASMSRTVYKLDGSESVNATAYATTRSHAAWKGRALVVTGTTTLEINGGELVETTFVSTYTQVQHGDIHVETRSTSKGEPDRVSWLAMIRQHP